MIKSVSPSLELVLQELLHSSTHTIVKVYEIAQFPFKPRVNLVLTLWR